MSRRRRKSVHEHTNIIELTQALTLNGRAQDDGPRRKHWSRHDLKHIRPMTMVQEEMFNEFFSGKNICAHGSAGTGKTFIASYLALNELLTNPDVYERIIIVRSAVSGRDQGFLPGTLEEKMAVYEAPYVDVFAELMGRGSTYRDMKEMGLVEFQSTSYLRSLTWDNAIVIVDESQDMNFHELNSVMTRLGNNTRIIIAGDCIQDDLKVHGRKHDVSGLPQLLTVVSNMSQFSVIKFTRHDIVRGPLVKAWISACEDAGIAG